MAPGADILVVSTPVSETEGVAGFPEIVQAENYVIDNGLADVISQSSGRPSRPSRAPSAAFAARRLRERSQARGHRGRFVR